MFLVGLYPVNPVSLRAEFGRVVIGVKNFLHGEVVKGDRCWAGVFGVLCAEINCQRIEVLQVQ